MSTATKAMIAAVVAAIALPAQAEVLRWASAGDALTLDPHSQNEGQTHTIRHQMYEALIIRDVTGAFEPALATDWAPSADDPNVWVFNLRQGVKFHNGQEMTAEDVAYTFSEERLWGDEAIKTIPNGRNFSPNWDEPEVVSKYQVRLKTKTPSYQIEKFAASWIAWVMVKGSSVTSAMNEPRPSDRSADPSKRKAANRLPDAPAWWTVTVTLPPAEGMADASGVASAAAGTPDATYVAVAASGVMT